jgi:hypothetical protein
MSWCTSFHVSFRVARVHPVIDATFCRNPVFTTAAEVALHLLCRIIPHNSNHTPLEDLKSAKKEF